MMLAEPYDAFLFDLDGVLYLGHRAIPGAGEVVATLRGLGKRVSFVTNNSSRTPDAVAAHLRSVGVAASSDEVETSAHATAQLLRSRGVSSAFVIGEDGIREALRDAGIDVLDGEPPETEAVVVGFDRAADYAKLRTASILVQRGASLIATNADASLPLDDGTRWPGAGALLAAIEVTSACRGEVIGKPHAPLLESALARAGGGLPIVIGDRLDTDIAGAVGLGWDSALVLTGISTREEAEVARWRPTFVLDTLGELVQEGPS